jgi:uncharacterized protein YbjQ (UPF0145 family)
MIQLTVFIIFVACGFFFGRLAEKKHFKSLNRRERLLSKIKTTTIKTPFAPEKEIQRSMLVCGELAVSVDYFKNILGTIIGLLGGNIKGYDSLLERARREATLRMKECIPGANEIINLRLETSTVAHGPKQHVKCVIVMASGTALLYHKD